MRSSIRFRQCEEEQGEWRVLGKVRVNTNPTFKLGVAGKSKADAGAPAREDDTHAQDEEQQRKGNRVERRYRKGVRAHERSGSDL